MEQTHRCPSCNFCHCYGNPEAVCDFCREKAAFAAIEAAHPTTERRNLFADQENARRDRVDARNRAAGWKDLLK